MMIRKRMVLFLSKPVNEERLAKASKAIQYVEQHLLKTCSKRHKVTFCIAKSDYYIRKAQMDGRTCTPELTEQYTKEGEQTYFQATLP